jgi:anti-anti-sigma factor
LRTARSGVEGVDWKALPDSAVTLRVNAEGSITTIAVAGELDVAATDGVLDRLEAELARGPSGVVVDLSELAFIDSTGLRALLQARDLCARHGARMSIVEARGHVARVFELTGLRSVLPIVPRASESVEAST